MFLLDFKNAAKYRRTGLVSYPVFRGLKIDKEFEKANFRPKIPLKTKVALCLYLKDVITGLRVGCTGHLLPGSGVAGKLHKPCLQAFGFQTQVVEYDTLIKTVTVQLAGRKRFFQYQAQHFAPGR